MRYGSTKHKQAGYLLEFPIIIMLTGIVLAVLLPILPELGRKLLSLIAAPIVIYCLHYMIVKYSTKSILTF